MSTPAGPSLGAFSISLAVADIAVSRAFYESLGFVVSGGDQNQNWLILRNGDAVIGLFQGMFDENVLTFTPGWDQSAQPIDEFTDVRDIQRMLSSRGIPTGDPVEGDAGPGHLMIVDPDGNSILIDQHR